MTTPAAGPGAGQEGGRRLAGSGVPARWHAEARDVLVVVLTLTTGAVDAASFLHLGSVFSSVITGNMVILGIAAATRGAALAAHSGVALAGYAAGVAAGAPVAAGHPGRGRPLAARGPGGEGRWQPSVTLALALEICVLAAFAVGWELTGGRPGRTAQLLIIAALAAAMGIQSAAVRHLGEMSTTYLTGTLTGVVASVVTRRRGPGFARSVGVLLSIVVGAFTGAVVAQDAPAWLPVVVMVPIGLVVIGSLIGFQPVKRHFDPRAR